MPVDDVATALLAHDLRETLGRIVRRLRAEPGPPVSQLSVLNRLDRQGAASVSDLAAAERMRPQSMAQLVRELEALDQVARRADPADGRRAFVDLTPIGRAALEETRARREDWLTQTLDRTLDPAERERLRDAVELLRRVADA